MNYVTFVAEAAWSRETQIRAFAQLREGWHYGEGRGATEKAMATALEVDSRLLACNVHKVEVFPGVDGGILLSVYHENDTLEVRCDPSGRMDMLHEVNDEVVNERHGVSLEKIGAYLEGLEWTPKNSFAYCIQGISASTGEDSQVRPFSRSTSGGISVFDTRCAVEHSDGECPHIGRYYPCVAGEPPVFWRIDPCLLPKDCWLTCESSTTGDTCHRNLHGLARGRRRSMIKGLSIEDLEICDGDGHRPLTPNDTLLFATEETAFPA